jgi:hypothetical protein
MGIKYKFFANEKRTPSQTRPCHAYPAIRAHVAHVHAAHEHIMHTQSNAVYMLFVRINRHVPTVTLGQKSTTTIQIVY